MTAHAAGRIETRTAPWGWSPPDLLHALAQLPEGVSLELESNRVERGHLELLSRAYGLEQRLSLRDAVGDGGWRFDGVRSTAPYRTGPASDAPGRHAMADLVDSLWPPEVESAIAVGDDSVLSGHRIAVLTNTPSHYRMPLFEGLAQRATNAEATLRVFFLGTNPARSPWLSSAGQPRFDHEFVSSLEVPGWVPLAAERDRRSPPRVPRGLGRRLRAFRPSIVLSGGFSFASIAARRYATRHRIPLGIWSGETQAQAGNRSYPAPRARQRRWLARHADFGVAYGSEAARYLRGMAPRMPVVIGRNTSVVTVAEGSRSHRAGPMDLLAVADLSLAGKGLEVVVEALDYVRPESCRLSVIGNPPPNGTTAHDPKIRFLGPLPHADVTDALADSDVFVFPSRVDIFGLALVEAMAAGLPSIASDVPGAVTDLGRPGVNCLVAGATDARAWAEAIMSLEASVEMRAAIGSAARTTVRRRWTMAHAVESMMAGFRLGALRAREGAA